MSVSESIHSRIYLTAKVFDRFDLLGEVYEDASSILRLDDATIVEQQV